ncbi:MAG: sigma 54-interacting transcriptional regulator [Balneolaceae bacterium]|nr:sigma 54-interacting transcriptional regulator [Balneolaceae bacterium]
MITLSDKPIHLDPPKNGAEIESANFYSEIMRELYKNIVELAHQEDNIILVGEQGTGKHRTAQMIHSLSPFSDGPFGNLFCNTLEEIIQEKLKKLERTLEGASYQSCEDFGMDFLSGGTLFFNSFTELSHVNRKILVRLMYNAQQMALNVEEIQKFRVIISIEHHAYHEFMGSPFWNDLAEMLNPIIIHMPPLRERCEDIILLIDQFLIEYAKRNGTPVHAISPRAVYKCLSYSWPGNIRQLKNTIEHAATAVPAGSVITTDELPFSIDWKSPYSTHRNNEAHNNSFQRAEKLFLKELVASSFIKQSELENDNHNTRISFKNKKIYLS